MPPYTQFTIERSGRGLWTATFSNPPLNLLDPVTIVELQALVSEIEADMSVKVLIFQATDPDFFIAHFDTSKAGEMPRTPGPTGYAPWIDFVLRLSAAAVISIAKIRGRTRGVGNEFVLACDLRFASRQRAVFGNPEIGFGLPAGGGALEWLPRLVGRSRALEIALSGDDFDADLAERYGWVNRTLDDSELDTFVENLAIRIASFDREALGTVKNQINRIGIPSAAEFESSNKLFFSAIAAPHAQARRARGDFELNFGRRLPSLMSEQR
jgi:enoyl-CoA hydratase/carnithine racemase